MSDRDRSSVMARVEQSSARLARHPHASALAAMWLRRARSELQAASCFEVFAQRMTDRGMPEVLQRLARRAIDDELGHAELCRSLACAYAGRELPRPVLEAPGPPEVQRVSRSTAEHLQVLGMLCVNESLSTVYLSRCHAAATDETARASIRALLRDEVDHARIGWGYLEALTARERQGLSRYVGWLLQRCHESWRASLEHWPSPAVPEHGLLARDVIFEVVAEATRSVVVPGFARVGFAGSAIPGASPAKRQT